MTRKNPDTVHTNLDSAQNQPLPKKRNWFARHKFLTTVGVVVLLFAIGNSASSNDDNSKSTAKAPTEVGSSPSESTITEEAPSEGAYAPFTVTGNGDDIVTLPDGVTEGLITATFGGDGFFSIAGINNENESTLDLPVMSLGAYQGTTSFGGDSRGTTKLKVSANASWELTIAPKETAPVFSLPLSGSSDAVYRYNGGAATVKITHKGEGAFSVTQSGGWMPDLHVLEIGNYEGTIGLSKESGYIDISASSEWSITE